MSGGRVRSWLDDGRVRTIVGLVVVLGFGYLFGQYVFFDLSLTGRALLILGIALLCFAWTAAPGSRNELPAFGMVASLIALIFYLIVAFAFPPGAIFLLVLVSLVGVPVLIYAIQSGRLAISGAAARYATVGILLLAAGFVGMDLAVGEVTYSATLDDEVTLGNDSRNVTTVRIGSAAATNTFLLREPVNFPTTNACIYTGERRQDTGVFYRADGEVFHDSVGPGASLETKMNLRVMPNTTTAVAGPLPIERAENCPPADDGPPRILVVNAPPAPNATG